MIAFLYDENVINELIKYSFLDVGDNLIEFKFSTEIDRWEFEITIIVYCQDFREIKAPRIETFLIFDIENWAKSWSIVEFAETLKMTINELKIKNANFHQEDETVLNGVGITVFIEGPLMKIEDQIDECIETLKDIVNKSIQKLSEKLNENTLSIFFNFPEEIKAACKQYLVYFAQFLADIGMEANTEIKDISNKTLFTIIPSEGKQALEKIKEAIMIYLNVPADKEFEIQVGNYQDISVKQWESNVYHLKSQLSLAKATIQAKDAAIESLQLSNYHIDK